MVKAWGQGSIFHFGRVIVAGLGNKRPFHLQMIEPSLLMSHLLGDGGILDGTFKRITVMTVNGASYKNREKRN